MSDRRGSLKPGNEEGDDCGPAEEDARAILENILEGATRDEESASELSPHHRSTDVDPG